MATEHQPKRISERAVQMKKHFIELHNEGLTIPQIAATFELDKSTVYRLLDDIAEENGVSRESLL